MRHKTLRQLESDLWNELNISKNSFEGYADLPSADSILAEARQRERTGKDRRVARGRWLWRLTAGFATIAAVVIGVIETFK